MSHCVVIFIVVFLSGADAMAKPKFSKVLTNHTFLNLFGKTISQCEHECSIRPACKSINYGTHMKECQLNSKDETEEELTEGLGFIYVPKKTASALCDQKDCSLGHVCEPETCNVKECSLLPDVPGLLGNMVVTGRKRRLTCIDDVISPVTLTLTCDLEGQWAISKPEAEICLEICPINYLVSGNQPIPDSSMTASSYWDAGIDDNLPPFNARLFVNDTYIGKGAWAPRTEAKTEYIQASFPRLKLLVSVATMGRYAFDQFVKTYTMHYSLDCKHFRSISDAQGTKIFTGNSNIYDIHSNKLPDPVLALCVRIYPQTSQGFPSLRFDFKGCHL